LLTWAGFAKLDEVAVGEGKVTPASKGQIIQSLEGGILASLPVREGDIVEPGQNIATLDPVQARASMEEALSQIMTLKSRAVRLQAEMNDQPEIKFPEDVTDPSLIEREEQLFFANRKAFSENLDNLEQQKQL